MAWEGKWKWFGAFDAISGISAVIPIPDPFSSEFHSYEFKVKPKNELGEGPSSEPVSFNTESGTAQSARMNAINIR